MERFKLYFEWEYYLKKYPDVNKYYNDKKGAENHFYGDGIKENRMFNSKLENLNIEDYISKNIQLKNKSKIEIYLHYLENFFKNKYKEYFDWEYYLKKYPDVNKYYNDIKGAEHHFYGDGIKENRMFNLRLENLNIEDYISKNIKFKNKSKIEIYLHYLENLNNKPNVPITPNKPNVPITPNKLNVPIIQNIPNTSIIQNIPNTSIIQNKPNKPNTPTTINQNNIINIFGLKYIKCSISDNLEILKKFYENKNYIVKIFNITQIDEKFSNIIICAQPYDIKPYINKIKQFKIKPNVLWVCELNILPNIFNEYSVYFNKIYTVSNYCYNIFKKELNNIELNNIELNNIELIKINSYIDYIDINQILLKHKVKNNNLLSIFKEFENKIKFGYCFDCNSSLIRKNIENLVDAFTELNIEDHVLILKVNNINNTNFNQYELNIINKIKNSNRKKIILITEYLDLYDLYYMYNNLDYYISPHLCEGFGITIYDNYKIRTNIISTFYSGEIDYLDKNDIIILNHIEKNVDEFKNCSQYNHYTNTNCAYVSKDEIKNKIKNIKKIPKNIFQTWHSKSDISNDLKDVINSIKNNNTDFNYYLYDDNECLNFIKNNFSDEIYYSYNKLKPTAYKADLWRYCVLYKYGGIYLDIKFKCYKNFSFEKYLTSEYWVRDKYMNKSGIYQGLLICKPQCNILLNCINKIVSNCKNSYYSISELCPTGPGLVSNFISDKKINKLKLFKSDTFNNQNIICENDKDNILLISYDSYRAEQDKSSKIIHYRDLWHNVDIYNYPLLKSLKLKNFTDTIKINNTTFYSSNINLIKIDDKFLVNIRWINYSSIKELKNINTISLNTTFYLDNNLSKITEYKFDKYIYNNLDNFKKEKHNGIEDIRTILYNNNLYYIGSIFQHPNIKITSSSIKDINNINYDINIINYNNNVHEKNWSFYINNNKLNVIYSWYPLSFGYIDYNVNKLIINKTINTNSFFENISGSTPGFFYKDECWFLVHKKNINKNDSYDRNYTNSIVIFDKNMNLLKYSELFKLTTSKIEFCTGLHIEDDEIILSFSENDTSTFIGIYDINVIQNELKWYLD